MKLTVLMGSSGRPVAQSITVCIPTNVAGIVSGLLRSACSKSTNFVTLIYILQKLKYITVEGDVLNAENKIYATKESEKKNI